MYARNIWPKVVTETMPVPGIDNFKFYLKTSGKEKKVLTRLIVTSDNVDADIVVASRTNVINTKFDYEYESPIPIMHSLTGIRSETETLKIKYYVSNKTKQSVGKAIAVVNSKATKNVSTIIIDIKFTAILADDMQVESDVDDVESDVDDG